MAFDGGFLYALIRELNKTLSGARVDKIYQPSQSEIIISMRVRGEYKYLLISAAAESSRIHITSRKPENPKTAPNFCMLLRKHLSGGHFRNIEQYGFDRCCRIIFDVTDEIGDRSVRVIECELMGRNSNIIFCDGDGKILAPLRAVDLSMSRVRAVLPGLYYTSPPSQGKKDPLTENICSEDSGAFLREYEGISPLIAREIECRAGGGDFPAEAASFIKETVCGKVTPLLVTTDKRREITYTDITQYGGSAGKRCFDSFSELCDYYYGERDLRERMGQRSQGLKKICSAAEGRIMRKLEAQRCELAEALKKEDIRKKADLITANIYKIKQGDTFVEATDYTLDPPEQVVIELDSRLSPSANAQRLYKKYAKMKTAAVVLEEQIKKGEDDLAHIKTISDALGRAETEKDLREIKSELRDGGYISERGGDRKQISKKTAPEPMEFESCLGHRILCGKNNTQNDYIRKIARGDDYWFHIQKAPGSHVVILSEGDEITDDEKNEAALIAAHFSSAGGAARTDVDYTQIKELRHPPKSAPGYVTYHTYSTASILPDTELLEKIKRIK